MQFVVEYRRAQSKGDPLALPSLNTIEAETLNLAQREVMNTLLSGVCDEAIVYQPVRVLKASRTVVVTEPTGKKVEVEPLPTDATSLHG